ncbi:MAG: TetR/AcrR family transcriptional regulator [Luteimonas sp.]|nr:TetR/AcrR family transcriptional regulator [Luteimonas sp.]
MTVDAILEAASILFAKDGFDATSTTRIAERAGVSVGSLYEYFPNKEALVAKLIKRHCDRMIERFAQRFRGAEAKPLEDVIASFVEATHEAYAENMRLHRVLLEQMGKVSRPHHLRRVSLAIVDLLEQALAKCGSAVRRPSIRLAAFVVETTVEALTHRAILYAPEFFNSDLNEELRIMTLNYLKAQNRDAAQTYT